MGGAADLVLENTIASVLLEGFQLGVEILVGDGRPLPWKRGRSRKFGSWVVALRQNGSKSSGSER